jgi:hypothetical protein
MSGTRSAADAAAIQNMQNMVAQALQAAQDAQAQATTAQAALAAAVAAAPVPAVGMAAILPAFALFPGLINNNHLDYSRAEDRKIYTKAIAPLSTQFNLEGEQLQVFLEKIQTGHSRSIGYKY